MGNWYEHERREKKKYVGPRPIMPERMREYLDDMHDYLETRQLSFSIALDNGWYPTFDDCPRIVIPCSNSLGVPYWQARAMVDGVKKRYDSPAAPRDDSLVIVWPLWKDYTQTAVIVEGPMDALAAAGTGAVGIGIMGNKPSPDVLKFLVKTLKNFIKTKIIIVPDLDTPEMGAELVIVVRSAGIPAVIRLPLKKDLAEMTEEQRKELLK